MKNPKLTNRLLGVIAFNLTLITLIQLDIFPPKAYANEVTTMPLNANFVSVPVNNDGSINVKLSEEQLKALMPVAVMDVNIAEIGGAPSCGVYCQDGSRALSVAIEW